MTAVKIGVFEGSDAVKRHERENVREEGGINMRQEEEVGLWETLTAFVRKISAKVLMGRFNFSTMQRPAALSNPTSHIQVIANEYCVLTRYVEAALAVKDPVERLKLVTAGLIGNLSLNVYGSRGKGPVNPSLGETYHVCSIGQVCQRLSSLRRAALDVAAHHASACRWPRHRFQLLSIRARHLSSSKFISAKRC